MSPLSPPPTASPACPIGNTGRVTQNESVAPAYPSPRATWTAADLDGARLLSIGAVPISSGGADLVNAAAAQIEASEAAAGSRGNARRADGKAKLRRAVAGVVGGVIDAWGCHGRAVFHPREPKAFTGGLVAHRQYIAAVDGMKALGLLHASPAIRYGWDWGDSTSFVGKTERFRPAQRLLDLATAHGVTPATIRDDFAAEYSVKPPTVPPVLVTRRPLAEPRRKGQGRPSRAAALPIPAGDEAAQRLSQGVLEANGWAAQHDVKGCLPPRWYRPFGPDWRLGGRWTALGADGVYQRLGTAARRRITINGEDTAEVDLEAAHLSIMHGLLGLPMPAGDLYAVAELRRAVVKAWVTATLGKGTAVRRWARGAVDRTPELAGVDAGAVGSAVIAKYPFLAAPAKAVAVAAGLDRLNHLAKPERLLTHRLMALEAAGLTAAMHFLRVDRAMLALPVHDSLIVPVRAVRVTREALAQAFSAQAGLSVRTRVV